MWIHVYIYIYICTHNTNIRYTLGRYRVQRGAPPFRSLRLCHRRRSGPNRFLCIPQQQGFPRNVASLEISIAKLVNRTTIYRYPYTNKVIHIYMLQSIYHGRHIYSYNHLWVGHIPSSKLTWRPCQMGVKRLVKPLCLLVIFRVQLLIYQRVSIVGPT